MKSNYFIYILLIGIFLILSFQIFNIVYSEDNNFNSQIEKQLISVVQIKGERINNYFLERNNDLLFLSSAKEINEMFEHEKSYDPLVEENIKREIDIIVKQLEVFINKYPDIQLAELQSDSYLNKIILQKFGERSKIVLIDSNSSEIIMDDDFENVGKSFLEISSESVDRDLNSYVQDTDLKLKDGTKLSIAYLIYEHEFRSLVNVSVSEVNYLENFVDSLDYYNLLLVDPEGYVIYSVNESVDLGKMLDFSESVNSDLKEVYSIVNNTKSSLIYGPYLSENIDGDFDLILIFATYTEQGIIVLQSEIDEINEILLEISGFNDNGDVYLVDEDRILIVPLNENGDYLVQEVINENVENCFENKDYNVSLSNLTSYAINYQGDEILGTYSYIPKTRWCLISEFNTEDIFNIPKSGSTEARILFVLSFNLILVFVTLVLINSFGEIKRLKRGKK